MRAANKHAAPVAGVADDDRAADQAALCVADRHGRGDERMTIITEAIRAARDMIEVQEARA